MQNNIYHSLLNLILRPREEEFDPLNELCNLLGEEPIKFKLPGNWYSCTFSRAGIDVVQWNETGDLLSMTFHISDKSVELGEVSPYSGDLPYGIRCDDSEEEVERKYPSATVGVEHDRADSGLCPVSIRFHFGTPGFDKQKADQRKLLFVSALFPNN